jgi:hypothetical protein
VRLPNPERAIIDIVKLSGYCLNPNHEQGKHKAGVFSAALGLTQKDAAWLRERLRDAVFQEATPAGRNKFGELYMIDCVIETQVGAATVRSGWIVLDKEDFPRLTTCFVRR